jgi:superfamily II DNA helicase RecQ
MPFKFLTVPINDDGRAEAALNAFVRSHRVLTVDRRWVDLGASSFWSFAIDYLDGPPSYSAPSGRPVGAKPKVDYKELLTAEEFAVFARLREVRQEIAAAESIPVYAVFTNEQLAKMAKSRATTRAALGRVEGVGEARLDKYAARLLDVLATAWGPTDEASRSAV